MVGKTDAGSGSNLVGNKVARVLPTGMSPFYSRDPLSKHNDFQSPVVPS